MAEPPGVPTWQRKSRNTRSNLCVTDILQPLNDGYPWGSLLYQPGLNDSLPDTNVTRYYNWTISEGTLSPDGYAKDMLLINGQFPGPLLEANWGDWIEVTVTNDIQTKEEGTTIHWHGLRQYQSQFADGVPGCEFLHTLVEVEAVLTLGSGAMSNRPGVKFYIQIPRRSCW